MPDRGDPSGPFDMPPGEAFPGAFSLCQPESRQIVGHALHGDRGDFVGGPRKAMDRDKETDTMQRWICPVLLLLGGLVSQADAAGCRGTSCLGIGGNPGYSGNARGAFLAAPWYLYWPYDAHFQTPAPVFGAFYPPPILNGYYSQPYFPTQPQPYVPGSPLNTYPYGPSSPLGGMPVEGVPLGTAPGVPQH